MSHFLTVMYLLIDFIHTPMYIILHMDTSKINGKINLKFYFGARTLKSIYLKGLQEVHEKLHIMKKRDIYGFQTFFATK